MRRHAHVLLSALASVLALPAAAAVPACVAPLDEQPQIPGVVVDDLDSVEGGYRALRVEAANSAHMFVYYDEGSESFARARAACLGAQLNLLQVELGDTRIGAEWYSVVFTTDDAYVPFYQAAPKTRFVVHTVPGESSRGDPADMILRVMPHEQVHSFQDREQADIPRWFAEGHATWVGTRISSSLQDGRGEAARKSVTAELATATGPIDLASWGSVRPRPEAIMRQVSPEDRARMEADPSYFPGGAFQFTQADLESDESNTGARYAGALAVFTGLEERHGVEAVRIWAGEITTGIGSTSPNFVEESLRRHLGESLSELLAEPPSLN